LQLLTQRGLPNVLTRRCPAEVQLLGKGNEIPQLPKLQAQHPLSAVAVESRRHVSVVVADAAVWVRSAERRDTAFIMSGLQSTAHDRSANCVEYPLSDGRPRGDNLVLPSKLQERIRTFIDEAEHVVRHEEPEEPFAYGAASSDRLPDATGSEAEELGRQGCLVLSEIRLLKGRASSSRRQA
jgi:hypothetical protein